MNAPLKNKVLGFVGLILVAVCLLSFSPAYGGTITENFTGDQFDTKLWGLWKVSEGTTTEVTSDRLEVTVAGPGYAGIAGYGFTLAGDFDFQVDFTLLNWPPDNKTQIYITANNKSSSLFQVGRGNTGPISNSGPTEIYFTLDAGDTFQYTEANGPTLSGTLRLVRTGNRMEGLYWDGMTWITIGSTTNDSLGQRVVISPGVGPYGNEYSGISAKVALDNIQITYTSLGSGFWSQVNSVPSIMELLLK